MLRDEKQFQYKEIKKWLIINCIGANGNILYFRSIPYTLGVAQGKSSRTYMQLEEKEKEPDTK